MKKIKEFTLATGPGPERGVMPDRKAAPNGLLNNAVSSLRGGLRLTFCRRSNLFFKIPSGASRPRPVRHQKCSSGARNNEIHRSSNGLSLKVIILAAIVVALSWQGAALSEPGELIAPSGKSQDADKTSPDRLSFKEQMMFDAGYILASPSRMEAKGYLAWGTILAGAGLMYSEKEKIREEIEDNVVNFTDEVAEWVEPLGRGHLTSAIAATFYLDGLLWDNPKSKETGVMIMESFFYTGIVTLAGQYVFAEERPRNGGEMHFFRLGGHGVSGHTSVACSISGPLNRQYLQITDADTTAVKLVKYSGKAVVYGVPFLTGLSRLNDDKHYSWNVLLGYAVGYTVGELVADAHAESKKQNIAVMPFIDDKEKGIMVSVKF